VGCVRNNLKDVYKHHSKWVHIATVYGAGATAEDCVQNAYIAIIKYAKPEQLYTAKGKVNENYIFFVVKSQVMNYHKKKEYNQELYEEIYEPELKDVTEFDALWLKIDAYTSKKYPLYRRILYKMWRANYTIREMSEITEVSIPTIVKELKIIKHDIKKRFQKAWQEAQEPRFG